MYPLHFPGVFCEIVVMGALGFLGQMAFRSVMSPSSGFKLLAGAYCAFGCFIDSLSNNILNTTMDRYVRNLFKYKQIFAKNVS